MDVPKATDTNDEKTLAIQRARDLLPEMLIFNLTIIFQHEEHFYNATENPSKYPNMSRITKDFLRDPKCTYIAQQLDISYYNKLYDMLVAGKNEKFKEILDIMTEVSDYNPVCVMEELGKHCLFIHQSFNRSLLDTSSLEKYIGSIVAQVDKFKSAEFTDLYAAEIAHNCDKSVKIKPLPPGKKKYSLAPSNSDAVMAEKIVKEERAKYEKAKQEKKGPTIEEKKTEDEDVIIKSLGACVVCKTITKMRCSGCSTFNHFVCSKDCQLKNWPSHKTTCKANKL